MCSLKNEVHLLMKNMSSCCASSPYNGWGEFFYEPDWYDGAEAERALTFFYQLALSALCTSIVSGAMAERCNFRSFLIFSAFNVFTYAFPTYWIW